MAVKKIIIKGERHCIRKEGIASEAITPGHLVAALPGGAVAMNDATTAIPKAFALERELTGDGIATDYAANDTVLYAVMQPGAEVYAISDAAVTAGGIVEAAANGVVSPFTSGYPIGKALETIGTGGRLKIEIL